MPEPTTSSEPSQNAKPVSGLATIAAFLFGGLLVVGGCDSLLHGRWPIYMPPQLDVVALVFGWSGIWAAYVAGTCSLLLGALILGGLFFVRRKERHA